MSKRIISQSEVDSFLSCKRRHYYAHGEKIVPIQSSAALNRGTIGHDALDAYFTTRKNGGGHSASVEAGMDRLNSHFSTENIKVLTELTPILQYWFNTAAPQLTGAWEILEVEKEYRLEVPGPQVNGETLVFPFKIDLLIKNVHTGKIYVVDNKFLQDFYSNDLITVLPQLAKYVGAMRMMGHDVSGALYNMIRTRPMKSGSLNDKVRVVDAGLNDAKIKGYLREQFSAMRQIKHLKDIDRDTWRDKYALRTANQFNCRACPFLDLCTIDLTGANGRDLHVKSFYKDNDYGYEELSNG